MSLDRKAHDGSIHIGDAQRDVVGGVAGLDSNGDILGQGDSIRFPRGVTDVAHLVDRTSDETMIEFRRLANRHWLPYIEINSSFFRIISTSDFDKPNGYAGTDPYGHISALVHPPTEAITDISMGETHPFATSILNGNGSYTDDNAAGYFRISSGNSLIGYSIFQYNRDLVLAGYHTVVSMEITEHNAGVSGDHIGYFGFKEDFTAQDVVQCCMVEQVHDESCKFITGPAAGSTETVITQLGQGDSVSVLMESGRAICYINGIVEAVHTTQLPTSTTLKAGLAAHADAVATSPRQYGVSGFNIARSG